MEVYTEEDCIKIQEKLKEKIEIDCNFNINNISTIAGVDIAYWTKDNEEYGACSIVVIDYNTKKVIKKVYCAGKINFPYISGCLAFRELPLVLNTVNKLTIKPSLYIFDGNGYLHPRHMGIATHASLYLNTPTIGIAKTYCKIDNVDYLMPDNKEKAYKYIIINNEIYGIALRTHKDTKPIFVSIGNYINLKDTITIVNSLVTKDSHIPIPTRLADIETHKIRKLCMEENIKC